MSNLQTYLQKTVVDNENLDKNSIKNNFYLLQENEIDLLKNDKKLFKHFYGEDNYRTLFESLLKENVTNQNRFRYGKIKCLINILEEKIEKQKDKSKVFYLEEKLNELKAKERHIRNKNKQFLILEEESSGSKADKFISNWEKLASKGLNFVFSGNKPEDGAVKKTIKLLLKVIAIGFGVIMYIKAAAAMPILLLPIIIMIGYFLYKILALGTKTAIKAYSKVISQKWVSKIFGIREEKLREMSTDANEFKEKFEKFISDKENEAKKKIINAIKTKIMTFGDNNPKLSLTIKIAASALFKAWEIFLSPITFIIQFFSDMLLKTCGDVADSLLKITKKESSAEAVISGLGFDAETLGIKKEQTAESLLDSLDKDYYDHIKKNVIKDSLFVKHNQLYNENAIDQTKNSLLSKFYKKDRVEVVMASFKKNDLRFDISPISGSVKIRKNKNQITDANEIKSILKANGLKNENDVKIGQKGDIAVNDSNFEKLKNEVFLNKDAAPENQNSEETLETKITEKINSTISKTEDQDIKKFLEDTVKIVNDKDALNKLLVEKEKDEKLKTIASSIKTDLTKKKEEISGDYLSTEQSAEDEKKNEETTEENLLDKNDKLYIHILKDSIPESLKITKEIPTTSDDVLGYIELNKKDTKEKNYRFNGKMFVRTAFNNKDNKLVSTIFESEENTFQNVTEKEAIISLRFEKGKYVINSGKFLGMFGEKSTKGQMFPTFKDYLNFSIKEIKKEFSDKYQLEIKKLNEKEKSNLNSEIDKELFNILNINFSEKGDSIKTKKIADLEKTVDFKNLKTEETKSDEETLKSKTIYINIKEDEKIDVSDLKVSTTIPSDGIGYLELTKKENSDSYLVDIYLKKVFDYKKNDLLKAIFEETETKNDFVKLTEEPAELQIKMENNKFILSQKGGFLGFNKKISKIGKINSKYKEYISNSISEIERNVIKNNKDLKKNNPTVKEKIENISNIDWSKDIKDIKEQKIEEIEDGLKQQSGKEMEDLEKEEGQLISNRNAIALGLFSFISRSAFAWYMGVQSSDLGILISGIVESGGKISKEISNDLFKKVTDADLKQDVKFDGKGSKTFFNKIFEKFGLKYKGSIDSAKVNPKSPEGIKMPKPKMEPTAEEPTPSEAVPKDESSPVSKDEPTPKDKPLPEDEPPKTTINNSYQYTNRDEDFLFNEYFRLESRLKK